MILGETALSLAAHAGHVSFLRFLLAKGAPVDVHPHGHTLREWVTISAGLTPEELAEVLEMIEDERARKLRPA